MTDEELAELIKEDAEDFFDMFSELSEHNCQELLKGLSEVRKIYHIMPIKRSIHNVFMWLISLPQDDYDVVISDLNRLREKEI